MRLRDRFIDGLTYRDLAGQRRMRHYVLAAGAILILLSVIVLMSWRQQGQFPGVDLRGRTTQTAATVHLSGEHLAATNTGVAHAGEQPSKTSVPHNELASTAVPSEIPLAPEACPVDPKAWELLPIAKNDNFKRIAPPCVYDGLARTVAWDLLRVTGYSAPEAAEALGFADLPWRPMPEVIGLTNRQGPMRIELANPSLEEITGAGHPALRVWIVTRDGNPGVTYTLRGCYQTETIQGDRVESWGVKYPVVCVAAMDQGEWAVMELGPHIFATPSLPTRRFFVYGYGGQGLWYALGYQKEPFVEIRLPASSDPAVLSLTMELEQVIQDWKFVAGLHGLLPWDAAWLEQAFDLALPPLPDNWHSFNDLSAYRAIQDEKDKWVKGSFP